MDKNSRVPKFQKWSIAPPIALTVTLEGLLIIHLNLKELCFLLFAVKVLVILMSIDQGPGTQVTPHNYCNQ